MTSLLQTLLGIGAQELTVGQMALRAVLTVVVALAIVRLGHKRLFGKGTAYDLVVAVMFGSVMSRAITNASGLFAVWLAGLVLVLVHRVLAALAFRFHWLGPVVKGHPSSWSRTGRWTMPRCATPMSPGWTLSRLFGRREAYPTSREFSWPTSNATATSA